MGEDGTQKFHPVDSLGHAKFYVEQLKNYLTWFSGPAAILTLFKVYGISLWWLLTLIPLSTVLLYLIKFHIFPGEAEAATRNNPEWMSMREQLDRIEKKFNGS